MDTQAAKEFIANSPYKDWYQSREIELNFKSWNYKIAIKGIGELYQFLADQIKGWGALANEVPIEFRRSKDFFQSTLNRIDADLLVEKKHQDYLQNDWLRIENGIHDELIHHHVINYDNPLAGFLIRLNKVNKNYYIGAYNYFVGSFSSIQRDREMIAGFLMANDFTVKGHIDNVDRRTEEDRWFSERVNNFKELQNSTVAHFNDLINNANKKFNESFEKYDFDINHLYQDGKAKLIELEKTYEEKLRLEKPAEYWNRRAKVLKKEGWISLSIAIFLLLIAIGSLYCLLWKTPEGMLKSFFGGEKHTALRWSIIFITFISFLFFGIQKLMKVTFSSFHLARDSEEREQLTYVYLAMINDSKIELEDRHLILQALFSRAETGLLKDDGGPTLPGGIIKDINK